MSHFPALNYLAVAGAAVAAFVLGWLWFGPIFGRRWQTEVGLSDAQVAAGSTPLVLGIAFALNLFLSWGLAAFRATNEITSLLLSAGFGVCLAITFVVPVLVMNYLFAQRSRAQLAIDGGYYLLMFALLGAVQSLLGG